MAFNYDFITDNTTVYTDDDAQLWLGIKDGLEKGGYPTLTHAVLDTDLSLYAGNGDDFELHMHSDPTFDECAAAFLVRRYIEAGRYPRASERIAEFVLQVNKGDVTADPENRQTILFRYEAALHLSTITDAALRSQKLINTTEALFKQAIMDLIIEQNCNLAVFPVARNENTGDFAVLDEDYRIFMQYLAADEGRNNARSVEIPMSDNREENGRMLVFNTFPKSRYTDFWARLCGFDGVMVYCDGKASLWMGKNAASVCDVLCSTSGENWFVQQETVYSPDGGTRLSATEICRAVISMYKARINEGTVWVSVPFECADGWQGKIKKAGFVPVERNKTEGEAEDGAAKYRAEKTVSLPDGSNTSCADIRVSNGVGILTVCVYLHLQGEFCLDAARKAAQKGIELADMNDALLDTFGVAEAAGRCFTSTCCCGLFAGNSINRRLALYCVDAVAGNPAYYCNTAYGIGNGICCIICDNGDYGLAEHMTALYSALIRRRCEQEILSEKLRDGRNMTFGGISALHRNVLLLDSMAYMDSGVCNEFFKYGEKVLGIRRCNTALHGRINEIYSYLHGKTTLILLIAGCSAIPAIALVALCISGMLDIPAIGRQGSELWLAVAAVYAAVTIALVMLVQRIKRAKKTDDAVQPEQADQNDGGDATAADGTEQVDTGKTDGDTAGQDDTSADGVYTVAEQYEDEQPQDDGNDTVMFSIEIGNVHKRNGKQ